MDVIITDTFTKSLKKIINATKFWKFAFWEDKYYELKWMFWALRKYFKIVIKMRPWDSGYILMMQKFQFEILCNALEHGSEEETSRNQKIKDIKRYIELLNNSIEDNYADKCGYDYNYSFKFTPTEDNNGFYLEDTCTPEQDKNNTEALNKSYELEKEEFKEMGELFQKIRSWWD